MAGAREIIRRAGNRSGAGGQPDRTFEGVKPVRPAPAATQTGAGMQEQVGTQRVVVPQPIRENSVYRQLMRSHDRMATRHLKG